MLDYSLRPKNRGKNLESSWQYMFKTYSYLKPWIDSLKQNQALKDTFIYSPDHVKLHRDRRRNRNAFLPSFENHAVFC